MWDKAQHVEFRGLSPTATSATCFTKGFMQNALKFSYVYMGLKLGLFPSLQTSACRSKIAKAKPV